MRVKRMVSVLAVELLLALGAIVPQPAWSITAFARKEGFSCEMCHTTIPHLNEYGFKYRKAGFRDPGDISQELASFNYADVFSARIQARYDVKHHDMGNNATTTTNQLTLHEITLYPIAGSFGKYYGSFMELSVANEDFVEIENAYFRFTWGGIDSWFSARAGIFHPFEGYGGSDRPYSISRPFFQGSTSDNGTGSTFFKLWGFDQAGVELAYVKNHTSLSATLFNGIFVTDDEGSYKAFPAAGGHLTKTAGFKSDDTKDIQLFVNQALKDDGSGLSAYYYYGQSDLPMPGVPSDSFDPTTSFGNDFHRVAAYGSWAFTPKVEVMGGYAWGRDNFVADTTGTIDAFNSQGIFGEGDYHPTGITTVGARFDWYDPSNDLADNEKWGITGFANVPFNDGFQLIAQYQHVQQKRGVLEDLKDDNFQIRLIWIQ